MKTKKVKEKNNIEEKTNIKKEGKNYSHFFLYLSSDGGKKFIARVKAAAKTAKVSTSTFIRTIVEEKLDSLKK